VIRSGVSLKQAESKNVSTTEQACSGSVVLKSSREARVVTDLLIEVELWKSPETKCVSLCRLTCSLIGQPEER